MNKKLILGISISSFLITILLFTTWVFNIPTKDANTEIVNANKKDISSEVESSKEKPTDSKDVTTKNIPLESNSNKENTPSKNSTNNTTKKDSTADDTASNHSNNNSENTNNNSNNTSNSENSSDKNNSTNSNSNNENSSSSETSTPKEYITVNLSGPKNSFIGSYQIEVKENDLSAFDITKEAFSKNNIDLKSRGMGITRYVYSINGIEEFDHGGSSGWMYKVNGSFPNKSCGAFDVKPNDIVEWVYTIDGGIDVGAR